MARTKTTARTARRKALLRVTVVGGTLQQRMPRLSPSPTGAVADAPFEDKRLRGATTEATPVSRDRQWRLTLLAVTALLRANAPPQGLIAAVPAARVFGLAMTSAKRRTLALVCHSLTVPRSVPEGDSLRTPSAAGSC